MKKPEHRKHILIITYNDYPAYEGLSIRIKNLSRVIIDKGHEVTIFAPNIENRQIKVENFIGGRIIRTNIFIPALIRKSRVIARAWSMVVQFLLSPFIYIKHIRNKPVNLIIAVQIYSVPSAIFIRAFTHSKIFVDDITTVSEAIKDTRFSLFGKLFYLFEKILFIFCHDFIHTSSVSNEYYRERGAISTLYVPNGVNCAEFKPVETNNNKIILFFNGSTYYPQNTEAAANFIKIGKKVMETSEKDIQFSLCCWPEHNLPSSVQNDIRKEKKWLSYKGGVEKIEIEIGKADITLLPYSPGHHITGGVRLKALEYMSCGKLVISTAEGIEGIIGLIPNEHFILAESIDHFPEIITDIINSPDELKRISQNARKFVLDHYDWKETMKELTDRIELL